MNRRVCSAVFQDALLVAFPVMADEVDDREALLLELEYLNESGFVGVGRIEIAAAPLITEFYERREFEPAWQYQAANPRCDKARAAWGLAPLNPESWVDPRNFPKAA